MESWQRQLLHWLEAHRLPAAPAGAATAVAAPELLALAVARALAGNPGGRLLVLAAEPHTAEALLANLETFRRLLGEPRPLHLLPPAGNPLKRQWMPENEAARSATLAAAAAGAPAVFVAAIAAALAPTLPPARFTQHCLDLAAGDPRWAPETLAAALTALDYDNEIEVHQPGEFARRGGILDLFSPLYPDPVRIEFCGNAIESLRFFRADTQRSDRPVERIRVVPRGATLAGEGVGMAAAAATFLDYFEGSAPLVLCDPEGMRRHLERFALELLPAWDALLASPRPRLELRPPPAESAPSGTAADSAAAEALPAAELFGANLAALGAGTEKWGWEETRRRLAEWQGRGWRLVAFCATEGDAERLRQLLAEAAATRALPLATWAAPLDNGFFLPAARLLVLTERELFGRHGAARPARPSPYRAENWVREAGELEEGEYAVHAAHGIGIYHGIKEVETGGRLQEALELEFADSARLFVPLDQIHLVSRYVGGSKRLPQLSRLSGAAWRHAREAAAAAAQDLAADLLRLAALRANAPGTAFPEENSWEKLFAVAFPYAETPDQAKAIQDVLADMARPRPMDRLVCGDVGYGKTEVAIRAAFRAVLNGRQVAVLVPTTILAEQHGRSFHERMAEYPVRIGVLSRLKTKGEQRRLLAEAAEGSLDILIGTHRLLQPDVRFRNLGLLVIDEEQRFGVEHKERLKAFRAEVDILTLTATPIPRTLYFSLAGLRDFSTIMSPPVDRLPIATTVCPFDRALVREAILRELERKGQVYFLHNRVQSIHGFAARLRALVPEARIGVAHGQMHSDELEVAVGQFLDGETDVLVCTTIIESGVDIPNANTILIDHAERFGLAELYQLRGRVGRYHHQAYAYFLLPPHGGLPDNARQRLAAIRRYTQLGAGFKLALRDLEIRGTGNLLGAEQSGHIAAVGFDLYCQLLKEAVARLEKRLAPPPAELPLTIDGLVVARHDRLGRQTAAVPPEYVGAERTRVEIHRRLRLCADWAAVDELAAELGDRFGPPPACVLALLELHRLRLLAQRAGLRAVTVRGREALLETAAGLVRHQGRLPRLRGGTVLERLGELRALLAALPAGGAGASP
ncbi:MAG: transcription-repair coupling factor [Lentisphaeria bacterium]